VAFIIKWCRTDNRMTLCANKNGITPEIVRVLKRGEKNRGRRIGIQGNCKTVILHSISKTSAWALQIPRYVKAVCQS
jgi:hypothetical protein